MKPVQKRGKKTKEKIHATAKKLFASRGFKDVSVNEIAEISAVNKERIYYYFGSKKNLFEKSLLSMFEEANEKDEQIICKLRNKDIPKLTGILLKHYMTLHKDFPDFWRMIVWANIEGLEFGKPLKNVKEGSFSHLRKLFSEGQKQKKIPEYLDFENYIFVIMSISFFYHSNRNTLRNTLSSDIFTQTGQIHLIEQCTKWLRS